MKKLFILILVATFSYMSLNAQWESCNNGLYGGDITTIVSDGTNIYAGTNGGGIFVSSNNGAKWSAANSGLNNYTVNSIIADGSRVFAGTNDGLFISTNNGTKWDSANNGLTDKNIHCLIKKGSNIYAGSKSGLVFISLDNGISWNQYKGRILDVYSFAYSDSILYAGTANGVYSTSLLDSLSEWKLLGLYDSFMGFKIFSLYVQDSMIYAGMNGALFRSSNLGKNWNSNDTGLSYKSMGINCIVKKDGIMYAATSGISGGIYVSTDKGQNWNRKSNGLNDSLGYNTVQSVLLVGNNIFAGTGGDGIYISTDNCANWKEVNIGLSATMITAIARQGNYLFAGAYNRGVFISSDNGANWQNANKGLSTPKIHGLVSVGNKLFLGTQNGVFVSSDLGSNWSKLDITSPFEPYVLCTAIDKSNNIYTGGWKGILKSSDEGISWNLFSKGDMNGYILSIAMKDNYFYAGALSEFYMSSDNGDTWQLVNNGPTGSTYSITFSGESVFAGTNGINVSSDNGVTWTKTLETGSNLITALASNGKQSFAGSNNGGIYKSNKNGIIWDSANTGLPNSAIGVRNLMIDSDFVYAGLIGCGVYKAKITDFKINVMEEKHALNEEICISPNPASGYILVSKIGFSDMGEDICIYNIYGEIVKKAHTGFIAATLNESQEENLRVDVSGLAAGMYYVRVGGRVSKFVKF